MVAIYLTGKPAPASAPTMWRWRWWASCSNGYVKNKVMEFVGPGVASLRHDYRNGIDVMTTETTCWSSIWQTDETQEFLRHGRPRITRAEPGRRGLLRRRGELDLSTVEPMIALPMHPAMPTPSAN